MRLHRLSMRAFGPFAGAEEVDFDELCEAGLFLLTGPTGAGKTSVLDAVCFALYGSVPGVRGVKALKSHHAADDARPEVVLEFSVRDRRFVVRRSPEWTRPKRRGDGFTTENARATLVELTSGDEHLLSSRAQEVGHFIGELVGMQATQFSQVAMLPQGEFQRFLRASSQDRHDVLQHLFHSDRYARIEEWVHEHSRDLRERSSAGQQEVVRVLATVADRAGAELPESLSGDALQSVEACERVQAWVERLVEVATGSHALATEQHAEALEQERLARSARDDAVRLQVLHERRADAQAALARLEADAAVDREAREALDADVKARRCLPLVEVLDEETRRRDALGAGRDRAFASLAALDLDDLAPPEVPSPDDLADLEQRALARVTLLEALLPRERDLAVTRERLSRDRVTLEALRREQEAVTARLDALPYALASAREESAELAATAARLDALLLELEQARRRLGSAREADRCRKSLDALRDEEREARDRAADARDLVQDLTERRLAGIAAELAGRLEEGSPCQVCGSVDHPAPASPSDSAVTEAQQAEASARHERAAAAHAAASGKVLQAEERLQGLLAAAGALSPADAQRRVDELAEQVSEARSAGQQQVAAERRVRALSEEKDDLAARASDLAVRIATLTQSTAADQQTIAALEDEIAAECGEDVVIADEIGRLRALAKAMARAREALCDHDAALSRVRELHDRVTDTAREHGFDDLGALRRSLLGDSARARFQHDLDSRADQAARARAVLEDEEVRALDEQEPPDVQAAAETLAAAEARLSTTTRALHQAEETLSALGRQRDRLCEALDAWAPVRERFLRADAMARLVRGTSADNQLQMRLSAYVLATRLDQVVAAANERLSHMRDQRYLLQRTGRAARKGTQAGLGLEVHDQWTGEVRDPATLSGGETFVVSLSLALGLADVVTQEAGGTEIETLFVDEGFGTLDADTLDDVMDRLDELRAGGRAVGVVSHVGELRNRIPTQLHVDKGRTGSVVRVRTAVG